jgi:hypothetical protein
MIPVFFNVKYLAISTCLGYVRKDYLLISNQVNYTNVENITTNYKHIYNLIQTNLQASKSLKHICTDTTLLKMPSSYRLD